MLRVRRFRYLVVGAVLLLAACSNNSSTTSSPSASAAPSGQPVSGGSMKMASQNTVATLDNSQGVSTIDYSLTAGALYEGLYHVDTDGNIVAALADGMPDISSDGLTYTIHMRDGAMFAGPNFTPRQVTATDAAYGMTRALDPKTQPAQSWGYGYLLPIEGAQDFANGKAKAVSGIKVVDPMTLQIKLTAPTSTFIYDLTIATSWPTPKEAVQKAGKDFGILPVGAGPFYLASANDYKKDQSLTLTKNPGYVDSGLPYLNSFTLNLNVDENSQVLGLQNGSIDAPFEPYALSQASLQQLQQASNVVATPTTGPTIYYWALNNTGILKNEDLRKAVAMSISKGFLKQFGTEVEPWNQIFASVTKQSDPNVQDIAYDPGGAKTMLQKAGYNGQTLTVIYDATDPFASAMSTSLKQDLSKVGIPVALKGLTQTEYFGNAGYNNPKNYDMLPTYWRQDYPDGQDIISTNFVCSGVPAGGLNVARWCDPHSDSLLAKSDALAFGSQRDQLLQQIQQIVIDSGAGVPVMQVNFPIIHTDKVGGLTPLPTYAPIDWKLSWLKGS